MVSDGGVDAVRRDISGLYGMPEQVEKSLMGKLHDKVKEVIWGFFQTYGLMGGAGLGAAGYGLYYFIRKDVRKLIESNGEDKLALQYIAAKTPWAQDDVVADKVAERLMRRFGSDQGVLKESVAMAKDDAEAIMEKLASLTTQVKSLVNKKTTSK